VRTVTDKEGSKMSDLDVEAIEARCEAATPGPWEWSERRQWLTGPDYADVIEPDDVDCGSWCQGGSSKIRWDRPEADADFIAHARSDIPALLTALSESQRENERLRIGLRDAISGLENMARGEDDEHWYINPAKAVLAPTPREASK
jgi:hypothetical protein